MKTVTMRIGDVLTASEGVLIHCCNDLGRWGKGFVIPLGQKYPFAYHAYKGMKNYELGTCQLVNIDGKIVIANIIGQRGIYPLNGVPPIRYEALESGLRYAFGMAKANKLPIIGPMLGCGLAGGRWEVIHEILTRLANEYDVNVIIYRLR